ncbi:MAG: rod shape-determining protein MreD [Elusimicrobiota bacterium]|nr:MAG: rod shape-determining protein MreD [Elusimicrobiota bacterium]
MISALRGLILFVLAMLGQWWWNTHFSYWGAAPQFLLALTVLIAARRGPVAGMLIGFGWGLYLDVARAELFGASALVLTLAAYFVGVARRQIDLRAVGPLAATTFLFTYAAFLGHGLLGLVFTKSFESPGWMPLLLTPVLNAVAVTVAAVVWDARGER